MKTVSKTKLTFCIIALIAYVTSYSQTPVYNSYPLAAATVYLDFDGHYLEGTSWNYKGPLTLGPSNLTVAQITEIFNRISEDYRPFNINITTDSTKYWSAPARLRMRLVFTITSEWYGAAGGVSYLNSFNWGDNTPCFVFTALLTYRTKYISEAASHEIGHTLGLNHQSAYDDLCKKTDEYNAGKGIGEIAWAPIMGVGYYRNFTLWHNGSDPWECSSYQDDLSIITNAGVNYRTDDYSNTIGNSTKEVNFVNSRFSIDGVIEKISDKDVFKFTMPIMGLFHLDANPYNVGSGDNGSNLDVKIELLSSDQHVLNSYNPELVLNATIDTLLEAGTYFLRVQSMGNVYAPDYASLGSYTLTAFYAPLMVLPANHLELNAINDRGNHKLSWTIESDETITKQTLEFSLDGINFQTLNTLKPGDRSFIYQPGDNAIMYYRLNVSFSNNHHLLSNIILLRSSIGRPSINNNLVHNTIQINGVSGFNFTVVDFNGRIMGGGKLAQVTSSFNTANLARGMYIIHFNNGPEHYTQKFLKQ